MNERIFINGIDFTDAINEVNRRDGFGEDSVLPGLKKTGTITISGYWSDQGHCCVCGTAFAINPDQPHARLSRGDIDHGALCDQCTIALSGLVGE